MRIIVALWWLAASVVFASAQGMFWIGQASVQAFPLTNWTELNLGGGGNLSGLDIPTTGVQFVRGDVFGAYVHGTDNRWHQLATAASMPAGNWGYYPANTSDNQILQSFNGVQEIMGCPSNSSCAYMYAGGNVFYSGNISTSNPTGITWCNVGGWTTTTDTSNNVVGLANPGQFGAVDPANPDHVIIGTPSGGLLETFNGTACASSGTSTWTAISTGSIPLSVRNSGNIPGYAVAFDPTSGTQTCHNGSGTCTKTAYVYTAGGTTAGVYKTTNAGTSWAQTSGGPTTLRHIKVSKASAGGGNVWAVDAGSGDVWELQGSTWTDRLNSSSVPGWSGADDVTINPNNGDHVAVSVSGATYISVNGSAATPSFTASGIPTVSSLPGGDAPWLRWAGIGMSPGAITTRMDSSTTGGTASTTTATA